MIPIQNYTKTLQDRGEWSTLAKNVGPVERVISIGAGGLLLGVAAAFRTPLAIAGGLLGAGLVARGVTGTCAVYAAFGASTATRAHHDHGLDYAPTEDEARMDDMLDDSFPCSDPPSFTPSRASAAR